MLVFDVIFVPVPHIMRIIVFLLFAALLGACGFKGPLYLPKPDAQPVKPAPASQQDLQKAGTQGPVSQ